MPSVKVDARDYPNDALVYDEDGNAFILICEDDTEA
jgi:hypothetical protein